MKTSINIPEWLFDEVRATCPDIPFGTLARDALLIALPHWKEHGPEAALTTALQAQLRMMQATADRAGVTLPKVAQPPRRVHRRVTPPAPAPVDPPTRPRRGGPKSPTTATAGRTSPGPGEPKRAPSRPKSTPTADSSAAAKSSRRAAGGTRRAASAQAASVAPANPAK